MNARNTTITLDYPIEAVKMNYLTIDQAMAYSAIKAQGHITKTDLALLGVTRLKQEKILGLLEALDRIVVDGEDIYFLPNVQLSEVLNKLQDTTTPATTEITTPKEPCDCIEVHEVAHDEPTCSNDGGACTYQELKSYLDSLRGQPSFKKLSDIAIDIDATAKKIFGYYERKEWKVGANPIKSWKGMVRRAVGDNYPNPWALTYKSLKEIAVEADAVRAKQQEIQSQTPAALPVIDPERELILVGLVEKKLGSKPDQSFFSHGAPFLTASQTDEWVKACEAYDHEFSRELSLARAKLQHLDTSILMDAIL